MVFVIEFSKVFIYIYIYVCKVYIKFICKTLYLCIHIHIFPLLCIPVHNGFDLFSPGQGGNANCREEVN